MLTFEFMDKQRADELLPPLFKILFANMDPIAPTGAGYENDFAEWYGAVRPAIEKPAREVIRILRDGELIGFFQYYVNETTFMMEEIQLVPEARGRGVFEALYAVLRAVVPEKTPFVEAYALRQNDKSQGILKHLGLERIGEENNCLHFRGSANELFRVMGESERASLEYEIVYPGRAEFFAAYNKEKGPEEA